MHRKVVAATALVVSFTIGVCAASATAVSARTLSLSTMGEALGAGHYFELEGAGNAFFVKIEGEGALSCGSAETALELSVIGNSAAKYELEIEDLWNGVAGPCESNGETYAYLELDGPVTLTASGKARTGPATVIVSYQYLHYHGREYPDPTCYFSRAKLTGTNTATPDVQGLAVAFNNKLTRVGGSYYDGEYVEDKSICPKQAEVSLTLPTSENDEPGEAGEPVDEQVLPGR
jgi:hypothetical protein